MTIRVTVKNEDSRQNAIIEVISYDIYLPKDKQGEPKSSSILTQSHGLLKGGESKEMYVTSTMKLEIIERQNG